MDIIFDFDFGGDPKKQVRRYKARARYAKRKAENRCGQCNAIHATGKPFCTDCHAKRLAAWEAMSARRKAEDKCEKCNQVAFGKRWCPDCLFAKAAARAESKAESLDIVEIRAEKIRQATRRTTKNKKTERARKVINKDLDFNHNDFHAKFSGCQEDLEGKRKIIDHKVPLKVMGRIDGTIDEASCLELAKLENLQLVKPRQNVSKGKSNDLLAVAYALELRAQGLEGVPLVEAVRAKYPGDVLEVDQ